MLPFAHAVHSLSSHSRSLVVVAANASYCAPVHVACDAHVPHAPCASVGATFMYSVPEHTFTAEHSLLTEADGARISHVVPSTHVSHAAHAVSRCCNDDWNVPAGHAVHERRAVFVSPEMRCPAPHVGWAVQLVSRCDDSTWYVLFGHALHVRAAVLLSTDITSPAPHVGCAVHSVLRWLALVWYVFAGHALHVRRVVMLSADINWPAAQLGCSVH